MRHGQRRVSYLFCVLSTGSPSVCHLFHLSAYDNQKTPDDIVYGCVTLQILLSCTKRVLSSLVLLLHSNSRVNRGRPPRLLLDTQDTERGPKTTDDP